MTQVPVSRPFRYFAVTLWGSTFRAPSFDRWVALLAHRWGLMGRSTRSIMENLVKPGMRVADVGANQGIYTHLLARLVGPSGQVTAFEPDLKMATALQDNLDENRVANVTLIRAGASTENGNAMLFLSPFNAGDYRLVHGDLPDACQSREVRLIRFDDAIADHKVDFIKIDTQGWEINVLMGMPACLAANPNLAILLEFWPHGLRQAGHDPADLVNFLIDHGFILHETGSGRPVTRSGAATFIRSFNKRKYTDLLATRE